MCQVVAVWVVIQYSDVIGHEPFGGSCCLHLQGGVKIKGACSYLAPKIEAACLSDTLVSYHIGR